MARVLISHGSDDRQPAEEVRRWLVAESHQVFLDQDHQVFLDQDLGWHTPILTVALADPGLGQG